MKNEIEKLRADAKRYFDSDNKVGEEKTEISESGNYYFTIVHFLQSDEKRNWETTKVKIYKTGSSECDFEFLANSEDVIYHFCWITKNDIEYLLLPEAMGGQSIYDTKNKAFFSFYSEEEPFIWLSVYPSPDGNKIAVDGCYWACPSELRIYDISDITELPYPLIYKEENFDSKCVVEHWEDNNRLTVCRNTNGLFTISLQDLET